MSGVRKPVRDAEPQPSPQIEDESREEFSATTQDRSTSG